MSMVRICKASISIGLSLVLLFSGFGIGNVPKCNAEEVWIEITDAEGLNNIRNNLSLNYKLMNHIDLLNVDWEPIGSNEQPFTGILDGNSKVITDLTINTSSNSGHGLFSKIGDAGEVRSLGIETANITAGDYTGILAGINSGKISRCYTKGNVTGRDYVGGIVGRNTNEISNSFAAAIVAGREYIGGLVGDNSGTISKSYSSSVTTASQANEYLKFNGSTNYVSINGNKSFYDVDDYTLEAWFKWNETVKNDVDFIIGKGLEMFEIHTGGGAGANGLRFIPITAPGTYLDVKNVIPQEWVHVAVVYDYQNPNIQAKVYVNGIAQKLYQDEVPTDNTTVNITREANPIDNNTNNLMIGCRTDEALSYKFNGKIADVRFWNVARTSEQISENKDRRLEGNEEGLVGYWKLIESDGTVATDSTANNNAGSIYGIVTREEETARYIGGLVGLNTGTVMNSFYDSDKFGKVEFGKGVPKTTAEMKQISTFNTGEPDAIWDFNSTWKIASPANNGYPFLQALGVYTISFNANGGSQVSSIYADFNQTITALAKPTRNGYLFGGWYIDEQLTEPFDINTRITENITFYASWLMPFTITASSSFNNDILTINATARNQGSEQYTGSVAVAVYNNSQELLDIIIEPETFDSGEQATVNHYYTCSSMNDKYFKVFVFEDMECIKPLAIAYDSRQQ